jgi:chromosome segregation ATPase
MPTLFVNEPEKAGEQATADSEVAREEFETAKRDVQLAKTEIESLNAERARLKAAVERLESDKIAAENKAEVHPDRVRFSKSNLKTERVATAYRLLFVYAFVRPESEQNGSHLQIEERQAPGTN